MKILAVESSGLVASIAVMENDRILAEYTIDYKKTHSQTLLPMIDEIQQMLELDLSTIDAIAVTKGPGSFTGLRIGAATVKGLAMSIQKPIIEVPTCEAMIYNAYGFQGCVCPIMDARRNQVYAGFYSFSNDFSNYEILKEQFVTDICEVIDELNKLQTPVFFIGDGIPVYREVIEANMKVPFIFAAPNCDRQRAASLAVCASNYAKRGQYVDAKDHKPDYLRLSQAERERLEKQNATN